MMLLKGMAWLGSMAGYVGFFAEAGPRWAAPLTAACSVSLILYAAGLAGLLQPCAWLLLVCGLCLLIRLLLQKKMGRLFPEFCLMAAAGALLWLRYRSALLVAYDDFSHWGMIVQRMLTTHAFPVAEDSLIVFQSYPPGAACWLYDAGLFWGNGDGLLLTAQGWLVLAGIWPLFGAAEGKYAWGRRIGMAGVLLVFLSLYQGTASLMVDNLLPAVAVGALSTGLLLQRQKEERGLWMVGIQLAQLCMIKDNGLFFAAAVLVLLLAARHLKGRKTSLKDGIALLLPALAARCLWLLHIKLAVPAAGVSRHALTLENLRRTGGQKSFEEMLSIGKSLLERMLSPDNLVLQMVALSLMIGFFEAFRRKAGKKEKRQACLLPLAEAVIALAYGVGLWGMYIFSMPGSGAGNLAAFERYNSSCALFLYGVTALWLMGKPSEDKGWTAASVLALCAVLLIPAWRSGVPRLFQENYHVPLRYTMEELRDERPLQPGEEAVLLVGGDEYVSFASYMARYVFQSPDIRVEQSVSENQNAVIYDARRKNASEETEEQP